MNASVLHLDNIYKDYTGSDGRLIEALAPTDFCVDENDFICMVGPSGCGKSTLLRITAGLEPPSGGAVIYRGRPILRPTAQIGMVFQEYSLLPWRNIAANIALGLEFTNKTAKERQTTVHEYLDLVGLSDFSQAFPHELSGGMRQRAAIARALAVEPDILLMDEPFGALDAYTRILLQKELLRVWEARKKTILFVTHSVDEAVFLANKIIVMSKRPGKIKAVLNVAIPRPRDRALPDYGRLCSRILQMLDEQ